MSTNGQLVFTDVDKITFKGVGNTSNAVVDTVTGKIGVGIDSPDANLHVLGNSYVSTNLELGGTLIMGTVNVESQHSLEAITATGNTTPVTVEFQNADTSLVASGNVEVGGELTASGNATVSSNLTVSGNATVSSNLTVSGNVEVGNELTVTGNATVSSNLTVSGNVEVGTANLFVDTTTGRVGIGTDTPDETLSIYKEDTTADGQTVISSITGVFSGSDATGGNINNTGLYINLDSSATGGTATNTEEHRVFGIDVDIDVTGDSDDIRGGRFLVTSSMAANGSDQNTNIYGIDAQGQHKGSGPNTNIIGVNARSFKGSDSTGLTTNMIGVQCEYEINAGTCTDAYGVRARFDRNGGAVTNSYLFYGDHIGSTTTITNNYGLYVTSADKHYLEGSVGIGTTDPLETLDVRGTIIAPVVSYSSNQDAPYLIAGTSGYTGAATNWNTYGIQHRIKTNSGGTPRITVDTSQAGEAFSIVNNGNVGIGTENPFGINGGKRLEGSSTTGFEYIATRDSNLADGDFIGAYIFKNADTGGTEPHYAGMAAYAAGVNGQMDLRFFGGRETYETSPTVPHMTLDQNGNLGVGTSSPDKKLHVYTTSSESNSQLYLESADRYASLQMKDNSGGVMVQNDQGDLRLLTGYDASMAGGGEVMRIKDTGNVGVGTTSPLGKLHISGGAGDCIVVIQADTDNSGEGDNPTVLFVQDGLYRMGEVGTDSNNGLVYRSYGDQIWYSSTPSNNTSNTALKENQTERMRLTDDGRLGIGETSPSKLLHIKQSTNGSSNGVAGDAIRIEQAGTSSPEYWDIGIDSDTSNADLIFNHNGSSISGYVQFLGGNTSRSTIQNGTITSNFTGQHRTFIKTIPFTKTNLFEGLIVCADNNKYIKMSGGIEIGSNAITINESLPVVSLCKTIKDKKIFGVISMSEDPEKRVEGVGNILCTLPKELGDTRVYINSLGEGAIWVININGPLESGDYITSSIVPGYGMKQDDGILYNYTVAKITMDCDFNPTTQPVQNVKKEMGEVNYWVKTTYENVTEEEYSNLTDENRRIVDGIYQKITKEESKTEQEGYELEVRQELVNVLDEHGQIQWENDPSGATEKAYKIRYLDADGNITDEANAVHIAAFVGCTYHCG